MDANKRTLLKYLGLGGTLSALGLPWAALARSRFGYPRLMQGPMVGSVQQDSALLWLRASGRFPVAVRYADNPALKRAVLTPPVTASPENDYIARIALEGLQPDRTYWYEPVVNQQAPRYHAGLPPFSFRTAPSPGKPARFRIAFGSCARVQEFPRQPIWDALKAWRPDLFFWLGDNVYADTLETALIAETYQQQRAVPEFQGFGGNVPQLATWDDHDYGLNNHDRTSPIKDEALTVFNRYWANPAAGTDDTPGVFFRYQYGGVDFFFLDDRYHRDPNSRPDGPEKTQLGAGQKRWLKEGLKRSQAPFKVLVSGGEWNASKGEHGDSWAGFLHERDEIFDFIRDQGISGVVLLSGNIHRAEVNAIPRSDRGGYDLYDLCSSPLGQDASMPTPGEEPELRIRPPYTGGPNAGILDFDIRDGSGTLTFNIIDQNGRTVQKPLVVSSSELVNGNQSWRHKIDDALHPAHP